MRSCKRRGREAGVIPVDPSARIIGEQRQREQAADKRR
jgi:hypothetical protein